HRYLLPQDSAGLRCDCAQKPSLDSVGIHLTCGCNKEAKRTSIHDFLVLDLESFARYAGLHTTHEEQHLFDDIDKNNRPDITINNPAELGYENEDKPASNIIIDVSFTCVLHGAKSGRIRGCKTRKTAMKIATQANSRLGKSIPTTTSFLRLS